MPKSYLADSPGAVKWLPSRRIPAVSQLDFEPIDALLRQRRAGHSLPQSLYTDHAAFEFDQSAIFGQSWLMAGLECELPKPGSHMAMMVGKWPVLITRDQGGNIHAFHNSCRHRGSVLCQPGHGSASKLVCPYHRWTYNLDGSLFAAARMPADLDKSAHGLNRIPVRIVAGAIFICLADEPPPFDEFGDRFAEYAGPLNFVDLKLAATDLMVEQANWKLVMDNARECCHCPTGHPELAVSFPVVFKGLLGSDGDLRSVEYEALMDALGLPHAGLQGDWWQIGRFALNEGAKTISMDGQHSVKKLLIEANGGNVGSLRWAIDPHLFAHATADQVFTCSFMPVSATETHAFSKWFVHKDAVEGVDYHLPALKELWIKTNLQDRDLAENNQRGVVSPGYTPGPYSPEAEALALRFTDWYCAKAHDYIASHG
jgi:glycine betaine catabolism A